MNEKWSIFDTMYGTGSIEENIRIATLYSKQYNVSHQPLFPTIPLTQVAIDKLHMFLHVGDRLIDLLIGSLRMMNRVNQTLSVRNLDGLTHLKTL